MEDKKKWQIFTFIFVALLVVISVFSIILAPSEFHKSSNQSASTKTNTSFDTSYLSISNIKVESNSSYTVCTGTITVKSSSPYRYRFIEVKGAFTDSYGRVVDTDSTYAIGSEGLDPGESKTFRLSVPKNTTIKTCSVSILK